MRNGVREPSASARAYASIRGAILKGEHAPGAMLSENELAVGLGMSRTPIRTALSRLQSEGWVRIYPRRGALVRELTTTEVREAAAVRHALESASVQHSDAERRAAFTARLEENVDEQRQALADGDFAAFATLALGFHRTFVEMSGNSVMLEVYDRLRDRQYLSIVRSAERIADDPQRMLAEHRALLDDARRGDWGAFAAHLGDHQARSHGLEAWGGSVG